MAIGEESPVESGQQQHSTRKSVEGETIIERRLPLVAVIVSSLAAGLLEEERDIHCRNSVHVERLYIHACLFCRVFPVHSSCLTTQKVSLQVLRLGSFTSLEASRSRLMIQRRILFSS